MPIDWQLEKMGPPRAAAPRMIAVIRSLIGDQVEPELRQSQTVVGVSQWVLFWQYANDGLRLAQLRFYLITD